MNCLFLKHVSAPKLLFFIDRILIASSSLIKIFVIRYCIETAQPQVSALSDETGEESAKLGLLLEQVDSHETRTKKLRGFIMHSPHNL